MLLVWMATRMFLNGQTKLDIGIIVLMVIVIASVLRIKSSKGLDVFLILNLVFLKLAGQDAGKEERNKQKTLFISEEGQLFSFPDAQLIPVLSGGFPLIYSTGLAPSTSTVTLLFSTSTKPACISKFAK